VAASEAHGALDIGGAGATGNQRRTAIDHGIPDRPRLVVALVAWSDEPSRQLIAEVVDLIHVNPCDSSRERCDLNRSHGASLCRFRH